MESKLATSATSSTASTPTIPKRKAAKCRFGDCPDRAVKIVGDCRYCSLKFCSRHRLPEAHACVNLISCQKDSFNKNAGKLLGEKCVASKV